MKLRSRTTLAVAGAALAVAAGAGGALAAAGGGSTTGTGTTDSGPVFAVGFDGVGPGAPPPGAKLDGGPPAAIADYLGLTQDELRTQLESGKTLAQIAKAQGKSVSGLEDVIYADAKSHLDQAVADGKLTADQEQTMLADMKAHLDDIVNNNAPHIGMKVAVGGPFGQAAAAYLGLTPDELRTQLESGKTLAQVAAAQGKSVDGLKTAILAGAKTDLDAAVAAGKLTEAQEQQMLDELKAHLDDIVNGVHPAGPVVQTTTAAA